ncbi:MAG: FecR domain-containing protein [Halieaceae bacterium]
MTRLLSRLRYFVIMLLFISAQAWAADGQIRTLSGGVFVNSTSATEGMEVNSGDTLSTGPGAWAIVVMSDGTVLNLKSNTKVEISDYVYDTSNPSNNASDVEIGVGTLRYVSGLIAISDPGDVKIRAGNTTLGLRGSENETTKQGNQVTTKIISGSWSSETNGRRYSAGPGEQIDVNDDTGEGETSDTPSGQAPSGEQGGDETGNLGNSDPSERGSTQLASGEALGDPAAPDTPDTPPPPQPAPPVFSDDPASTGDPNS